MRAGFGCLLIYLRGIEMPNHRRMTAVVTRGGVRGGRNNGLPACSHGVPRFAYLFSLSLQRRSFFESRDYSWHYLIVVIIFLVVPFPPTIPTKGQRGEIYGKSIVKEKQSITLSAVKK